MKQPPSLLLSCPPELAHELNDLAKEYKLTNHNTEAAALSAAGRDIALIVLAAASCDGFWQALASMFQTWLHRKPTKQTPPEKKVIRSVIVRSWGYCQETTKQTEFYNFDADELAKLIALYEKPDETIGCIIPSETEIQEK